LGLGPSTRADVKLWRAELEAEKVSLRNMSLNGKVIGIGKGKAVNNANE
jgi:hypothetical protein